MRRQRQEQGLAALEIHPLECLRIARLAGLQRDFAGLPCAADRDVLPTRRLECDAATAAVHNRNDCRRLPAAHRLQFPSTAARAFPLARSVSVMDCETGIGLVNPRGRGSSTGKELKSAWPPGAPPVL